MNFRILIENSDLVKLMVFLKGKLMFLRVRGFQNSPKIVNQASKNDANLNRNKKMQKNTLKFVLGGSWAPFGRGLGLSGASLGRFLAIFWVFEMKLL